MKSLSWVRYGESFSALCCIDDMEKTFSTHKVLQIEDQPWTSDSAPPQGTLQLYEVSNLFLLLALASVEEWIKMEQH